MNNTQDNLNAALSDALTQQISGKKFYESKTFWANLVAAGSIIIQMKYGFIISIETQALVLSVLNIGLRSITNRAIDW